MHISKLLAGVAAAAVLMIGAGQTRAAIINYHVSGTISETDPLVPSIGLGDLFSFDLSIDTATPDMGIGDPTIALYVNPITEFSFSVGAFTGGSGLPLSEMGVRNGFSGVDGLSFAMLPTFGDMPDGLPFGSIELFLQDSDLGLLASDNLEDALMADAAAFQDLRRAEIRLGNLTEVGFPALVVGTIDQAGVPPVTVPEPGSLALFGIGLAGLGFIRRRRRGR